MAQVLTYSLHLLNESALKDLATTWLATQLVLDDNQKRFSQYVQYQQNA